MSSRTAALHTVCLGTYQVLASLLISIESIINAKMRWRQLRACAGSLESLIWCFRARVGIFDQNSVGTLGPRPEATLCDALNEWRDELVAGTDLQTSSIESVYPAEVYRHYQDLCVYTMHYQVQGTKALSGPMCTRCTIRT